MTHFYSSHPLPSYTLPGPVAYPAPSEGDTDPNYGRQSGYAGPGGEFIASGPYGRKAGYGGPGGGNGNEQHYGQQSRPGGRAGERLLKPHNRQQLRYGLGSEQVGEQQGTTMIIHQDQYPLRPTLLYPVIRPFINRHWALTITMSVCLHQQFPVLVLGRVLLLCQHRPAPAIAQPHPNNVSPSCHNTTTVMEK